MANDSIHWLDVEEIGLRLFENFPAIDPLKVRFTELRRMIEGLEGFVPQAGHPVNEKILETVQRIWNEEREEAADRATGQPSDPDRDDDD